MAGAAGRETDIAVLVLIADEQPASLRDPWNFHMFEARTNIESGRATPLEAGVGAFDESGYYIWVEQLWLRAQAPDNPEWEVGFAAMLDHARSMGWIDAEQRIRAHVVRLVA